MLREGDSNDRNRKEVVPKLSMSSQGCLVGVILNKNNTVMYMGTYRWGATKVKQSVITKISCISQPIKYYRLAFLFLRRNSFGEYNFFVSATVIGNHHGFSD